MNKEKNRPNIVYAGRYSGNEILSGPELTAKRIFQEYCKENTGYFIQYFFDGREYSYFKKLFGKEVTETSNGKVLTLGILRIIPELRKLRPIIIHIITFERFALIFFLYRILFRVKVLYNSHGVIEYENTVLKKISSRYRIKDRYCEGIFLKHSDKVVFPSVNTLNIAEKYHSFEEEKAVILPNGIDDIFFNFKKNNGTAERLKAVIHLKNILNSSAKELLIETATTAGLPFDIFTVTNPETELPGNDLHKIIKTSSMKRSELAEFYKDKDIFLSLNHYDTFSISTAEAMASGLIPVVTTETGISRYIESGLNGFTFEYHLQSDLLNILKLLVNMPAEKIISISNNASLSVKGLRWPDVYEMYYTIYSGMIK